MVGWVRGWAGKRGVGWEALAGVRGLVLCLFLLIVRLLGMDVDAGIMLIAELTRGWFQR